MDLIITILPVVPKDLPISPRFTPYNFFIAMQVQHSYNSSTNGWTTIGKPYQYTPLRVLPLQSMLPSLLNYYTLLQFSPLAGWMLRNFRFIRSKFFFEAVWSPPPHLAPPRAIFVPTNGTYNSLACFMPCPVPVHPPHVVVLLLFHRRWEWKLVGYRRHVPYCAKLFTAIFTTLRRYGHNAASSNAIYSSSYRLPNKLHFYRCMYVLFCY